MKEKLNAGFCQMTPVWLNKMATIDKVCDQIREAAKSDGELLAFAEALVPGYPFWVERTNGAQFDSSVQKDFYAKYVRESVQLEKGDLKPVCDAARKHKMAIYLGIIERAADRGNYSLYASLVYIDPMGEIRSVHRKLMPTYDERLVWSIGDGNGLVTHELGEFRLGGLNCWENWMPLARASLYGQGENVHVMAWPGSVHNTEIITRFVARESRSFVISASSPFTKNDIPKDIPHYDLLMINASNVFTNGGSCIAGPDGEWIIEPLKEEEAIVIKELEHDFISRERQNFDPSGHYSRPDVLNMNINKERQKVIN
jgi:nitrilase